MEFRKLPKEDRGELLSWWNHKNKMAAFEEEEAERKAKKKAKEDKVKAGRKR
jgi:hypothetical protein